MRRTVWVLALGVLIATYSPEDMARALEGIPIPQRNQDHPARSILGPLTEQPVPHDGRRRTRSFRVRAGGSAMRSGPAHAGLSLKSSRPTTSWKPRLTRPTRAFLSHFPP